MEELKGFERVSLQPGERCGIEFILTREHLGLYYRQMRFEPGRFKVMVGTSSVGGLEISFEVVKE
ncbi:MAG: fibronectin type III-like domain-contianing protein [Acidobacteriota bacterium]